MLACLRTCVNRACFCEGLVGEAGSLALYEEELDMPAVKALLAAGPNHLGAAQPMPVATSDTLPPLLHTQVCHNAQRSFPPLYDWVPYVKIC